MARAQETTLPVVRQGGLWAALEFVGWRATQVGANTNGNKKFRLDGSTHVAGVHRCEFVLLALGIRIGQSAVQFGQRGQLFGCAAHHPNRFATPLHRDFFAWLDGRNIHLYRSTGRFRALRRLESADKRHCSSCCARDACAARPNDPSAFAGVVRRGADEGVAHENPQEKSLRGKPSIVAERSIPSARSAVALSKASVLEPPVFAPCARRRSNWPGRRGLGRQCQTRCRGPGWYAPAASPV